MPDALPLDTVADARVSRLPPMARLLLRGDPAVLGPAFQIDLPQTPCTSTVGDRSVLWLGPDEWLLLADRGDERWAAWHSDHAAAVDIGARQIGLHLTGARAADVLAVACPLDLDLRSFPTGACTRTVFGKAEIVLWRREEHCFHLEVWRSFAAYVEALLAEGVQDLATLPAG